MIHYEGVESIYFVGDTHGNMLPIIHKLNDIYKEKNSLLVFLGDCGIGFIKDEIKYLKRINRILKKNNSYAVLIRGNHDWPSAFNDEKESKPYILSNLRTIPDYSILGISGDNKNTKILCIGGAISIDRMYRTDGRTYWKDEDCEYRPDLLMKEDVLSGVDIVASHDAPDFAPPGNKFYPKLNDDTDMNLSSDVINSRKKLTSVFATLESIGITPKAWFYGHHHMSNWAEIYGCMFYLNDINEIKSYRPI